MPTEFTLIDAIARRAATRDDVVLGIGDDAAVLAVPAGRQLRVAMDTLNAGVHFPDDTAPADIGWNAQTRSDGPRVGKECTSTYKLRTSPYNYKTKKTIK